RRGNHPSGSFRKLHSRHPPGSFRKLHSRHPPEDHAMTTIALVAAGGGLAALAQFVFSFAIRSRRRLSALNLTASAALGLVFAIDPPDALRSVVGMGFLASVAPMAAIAVVTLRLTRDQQYRSASVFFVANAVGGVAAVMFGFLAWKSGITLYHKVV
ncbi:MAG: CrcB family protein, partial [Rhodococcus sp. (in: high G+C Gram-positive bacteria)]